MDRIPSRERTRPHTERRSPLFLVTGLILGLALGLVIAWVLWPTNPGTIDPSQLNDSARDQYRVTVALAYAASGDLGRAEARLALLGDSDPARALRNQAQLALLDADQQRQARALNQLAQALEGDGAPPENSTPEEGINPTATSEAGGG